MKGAVKMPPPGTSRLRGIGSVQPRNTLDGSNGIRGLQQSIFVPDTSASKRARPPSAIPDGPATKKQRAGYTTSHLAVIEDDDFGRSPTGELCGSQASGRGLTATVFSEFRNVDNSNRLFTSTKRRPRGLSTGKLRSLEILNDRIQDDDHDELGPYQAAAPGSRAVPGPRYKAGISYDGPRAGGDASDSQFYAGGHSRNAQHESNKRRRIGARMYDNDLDELGDDITSVNNRAPAHQLGNSAASISHKADIPRTNWAGKPQALDSEQGVPVAAAMCLKNLRYKEPSDEDEGVQDVQCFLRPDSTNGLRAFAADGHLLREFSWIKITTDTGRLHYNKQCPFIKVHQRLDNKSGIGSTMVLRFRNAEDAGWIKNWASTRLKVSALELESDKLASTWSNVMEAVMKELNKGPSSRRPSPDSANLAKEPVGIQARSREGGVAVPPPRSLDSRIRLLRKEETHSSPRKLVVSDIEQPPRKMLRSRTDLDAALSELANSDVEVLPQTPPTRRSRRKRPSGGEPVVVEDIPRWTEQNPGWDKHWDQPLVYNRSRVDKEDIPRLDEGQCLNDNIIDFGLRFLFDAFDKKSSLTGRVYLHSTHFHTKLTSNKTYKDKINYDGVKSWTSKVDLLSYDYVVVPVNEQFHWWLAIICNPGRLDPDATRPTDNKNEPPPQEISSDVELTGVVERGPLDSPRESTAADLSHLSIQSPRVAGHIQNDVNRDRDQEGHVVDLVREDGGEKIAAESTRKPAKRGRRSAGPPPKVYDPQETRIITLDSLGGGHSNSVTCLKYYLAAEFQHKRKKVIESLPKQLGTKATNIPEQDNFHDCGIYLLGYAQEFFKNPDKFVHGLLQRELPSWTIRASERRRALRDTIIIEHRRLHGIDEPAGIEEPHSIMSMKATVMPRSQQEEIVDTTTTPTSSRPSSSGPKLPIKKLQAGQEHVESPDEAAPNPPDNGGPRAAVAELSSEPSPNGTKLPGRLPSAESSRDEVSLLPSHDVKGSHSDAEPRVAENRPDSWQDSDDPVEFIPTLPVSSSPKARSDSEDVTVSKYSELKSPKASDKKPTAKRGSSEDIEVVGANKVVRRNRAGTPDRRPNARRDSGDFSEIPTSAFFASRPPASTQEKKPSVRERAAISLAFAQSRVAPPQPASSPPSRIQLQGQSRRVVPRVQAAELVREIPVDVDLTKEEPADVTYMEV
ncbi:hypothetical protein QBC34DRAFT_216681 [Podospora aff. communis PSN243]|uniref:Ubiquitin-like protease family profile domain-containing protein n=1 Tax=Podospora aff. communis PSN243 TaxID=3040156 RepID=A0AAV9GWP0_9PEZI|nr:hypothetical protein QBC34DRAFT_216681 [Podospora aff. communis PSN243]